MPGLSYDLQTLRRRARWLVVVRGVAAVVVVVVGLGLALGGLDSLVRWSHVSGRLTHTAIWIAAIVAVVRSFLVRPLRVNLTNLELAQVIHRQWPMQTPDLVSGIEFEGAQLSNQVGAPLLQQVTISRAQLQLATVPWQSVLVPGRAYGFGVGALAVVALLGVATTRSWEMTGVGVMRLVSPLTELDWPRRTTLVYLNSELEPIDGSRWPALRTGQGDPLTIYVENFSGSLPAKVQFEREAKTGEPERGELRRTTLRDLQGRPRQVAVASLPTTEPFRFRALGGDDDRAPWIEVDVVPTPRVQSFEITITPPPYTGRSVETSTSGVGHLQGLVGSLVHVHCRAVAPLRSVVLNQGNEPRQSISLTSDGLEFTLNWTLTAAERSTFWLDLVDPYGLRAANPPRYEIRGVADQEPLASLLKPESDLRVTSLAEISIEGEARDDLGLQRIELVYEVPSLTATGQATLEQRSVALGPDKPGSTQQPILTSWNLAGLALPPNSQVRFWLQATDAYNLNGAQGQIGRSAIRVVSIVTSEEKQQELSGRQIQIAERISQLKTRQAAVEQSTREIREQWKSVGTLRPSDQLDLDRVQSEQKEIAHELARAPHSVLADMKSLYQEGVQNQLTETSVMDSLSKWESTLSPLAAEVLPGIEKQLELTRRGVFPQTGVKPPLKEQTSAALDKAHEGQQRTLDDLTQLSTELALWQNEQDLEKQVTEIASRQAALREQSLTVGKQTSAKSLPNLSTQEQADLSRAADRQANLARDVEQLISQLGSPTNPPENLSKTSAFSALAQRLTDQSVAAMMRSISDELRQNHVQSATDAQQKLLESLSSLQEELEQDRSQTSQTEVDELRKSLATATDLSQRQEELLRRTESLSGPSASSQRLDESQELKTLQKEIEQETGEFAQRLRREQQPNSSSSAKLASQRMREAGETLEQEQVSQSLERQSEALDELEQTRETLDEELHDASQKADRERLSAVGQLVVALLERAKTTREETNRVEELRVSQGKWTRSQLKSVQLVATSQRDVAQSCQQAAEELASSGVMGLCLNLATEHFATAANLLEERDAGQPTQLEQHAGETLLEQFIASLPSENPSAQRPEHEVEQPQSAGDGSEQQPSSPLLAVEIRLLLRMQEELLARTQALADLKLNGHELSANELTQMQQLRDRQKKLYDTARTMLGQHAAEAQTKEQP